MAVLRTQALFDEADSGNTASVATSAGTASTDFLVAIGMSEYYSLGVFGPPSGGSWTTKHTKARTGDDSKIRIWGKTAPGGATTVTLTGIADEAIYLILLVYSGVNLTTPFETNVADSVFAGAGANPSQFVVPSFVLANAGSMLIEACATAVFEGTVTNGFTAPGTMTEIVDLRTTVGGDCACTVAQQLIAASGATGTRTFNYARNNTAGLTIAVALNAAATDQTLNVGHIASTVTFFAPTIANQSALSLSVGFHQQTNSIFTPVIENQAALTLSPNRIESSAQLFTPTIENQAALTLSPGVISSTAQIFSPTLEIGSQTLSPVFIDSTAQVFIPTLTSQALTLEPGFISSATQIFTPTLTSQALELTGLPIINSTVQLFTPTISNEGSQVFEPILVGNGSLADQIMNGLIDQGFLTGSLADREQARLLAKLGLTVAAGYSIQDLYFLANEENRLAGLVTV